VAKALKVIGTIAGAVATVLAPIAPPIAAIAAVVAGVANLGASVLYKPPPARGSVTNVLIAADAPTPYVMGEGYFGGVLRHDVGYGATLKKVPNPYRLMVTVYSHGGPVESLSPRVELAAVGSYYSGFLYAATQLGTCPQASALTPQFAGAPGWGASSKLSGQAAIAWNLKFDRDGKVFASGVPRLGAYGKWVKAYDPRKDSTFPGGSGSHRLGVESTYQWTQNPALHAGTYTYGRWQNGKRVLGVGMPAQGIDWVGLAGWANVCDANGWTIYGPVYEPGDRWENLQDICAAGGGRAVFAGGLISWLYAAPRVALDTITDADIADENYSVTPQASWRDRLNTVVPKYISPDHDWQMIADVAAVTVADYVTEDGEVKQVEWPFNLVKDGDQAAQLAAYKLLDSREMQPIVLPCLPRLRKYRPGECLHIDLPELGLDIDALIMDRNFDPSTMTVTLTMMSLSAGRDDFALGRTSTPPPTPALKQTSEERDNLRWSAMLDQGARTVEYDGAATYSQGMTMRWPDGSTWEYINAAPSSGNAPPAWPETANSWWSMLTPPLDRGKVFIQSTAPTAAESSGGDIWQDDNGRYWTRRGDNHLAIGGKRLMIGGKLLTITWTPTGSQPVRDGIDAALATAMGAAQAASQLALDAQATADGKVQSFYSPSAPTAEGIGDLWFDTDDGNKQYRWSGSAWVAVQDSAIGAALTAAAGAQATADGKVTTFVGESTPTPEGVGDLWFKPSTGYLARWSGSAWTDISNIGATQAQITSIGNALTAASNAQATADGKVDTYYQTAAPTGASVGDLWFDTDDGNKLYRHNGTSWVAAQDAGIGNAITAAAGAQATADGKVTTFVGESSPTAVATGDLWFKASTGELRRWSGSAWGSPLVDLTAAAVPRQEGPATDIFTADYQGTLDDDQLPRNYAFKRYRGTNDVTASGTTWSIVSQAGITGGTVTASGGSVTIPTGVTIAASATIIVKSARSGEPDLVSEISITRSDGLPPSTGGGGGTSASDSSFTFFSSTSFVDVSDVLTVTTGSGGSIGLSAPLSFRASPVAPTGSYNIELKWQYRPVGGSWTDVTGGAQASTSPTVITFDGTELYYVELGSATCSRTQSGLTASADYEVKLLARQTAGTARTLRLSGTATAVGS
jgi:hypothetical protein